MTLKQRITNDHLEAFKAKDPVRKSILSVVKGEIQTTEKNVGQPDLDDAGVMKILTKTVKSLTETIEKSGDGESVAQLVVLSAYMPQQMGPDEIRSRIAAMSPRPTIAEVMRSFAGEPVDRKLVAKIYAEA